MSNQQDSANLLEDDAHPRQKKFQDSRNQTTEMQPDHRLQIVRSIVHGNEDSFVGLNTPTRHENNNNSPLNTLQTKPSDETLEFPKAAIGNTTAAVNLMQPNLAKELLANKHMIHSSSLIRDDEVIDPFQQQIKPSFKLDSSSWAAIVVIPILSWITILLCFGLDKATENIWYYGAPSSYSILDLVKKILCLPFQSCTRWLIQQLIKVAPLLKLFLTR